MLLVLIALGVMLFHLYVCPFTKVEESFNIQAIHDIINHGSNLDQYDHLEFPGVVPRSFIGPLVVGILSKPLVMLSDVVGCDKFIQQLIVRGILGLASMLSFFAFCKGVDLRFGSTVKRFLILVSISQFHLMFYASRPLPNVFAFSLALTALSCWLQQQYTRFIWLAGASIIIFRFDLVMLFGLIILYDLVNRRVTFLSFVLQTLLAGAVLISLTVAVDSYFWQRWLWPEGEVMWFNVILNKSHEYGTSPFLWYFYSALPRALSSTLLLVPVGIYFNRPAWGLTWPAIAYIFLFSFLPHKELRFIIYTFPVFNTAAACAMAYFWNGRHKSAFRGLLAVASVSFLAINIATTAFFLQISSHNYPGGVAMRELHRIEDSNYADIHIDVFTAQTGVTRFTQLKSNWIYSKKENLIPLGSELMNHTHLLIGAQGLEDNAVQMYLSTHDVLVSVPAFDRLKLDMKSFPPLDIVFKEKSFVLKKKPLDS